MKAIFSVTSVLNVKINVTKKYWQKIVEVKHPSMKGKEELVKKTLRAPIEVRKSKADPKVHLYYTFHKKGYHCVVAKHQNEEGFIITTYVTEKIKEGEVVWKE